MGPHVMLVQDARESTVMVVGEHIFQTAVEVPQEAVARLRIVHHPASERRQVLRRVVTASGLELVQHGGCPVLNASFPTISKEVLDAALSKLVSAGVIIKAEVVLDVLTDEVRIEFVDFEPCG